ncbi:phage integrase SAM-like domain-containing protein [Longispora sp. NPDC051575]|uniref:phage integrase SAM-like domain-containing protein n=1 Tax=Longispora sp. NPDC051575 TaxID=3154943 RepID=UPI0034213282
MSTLTTTARPERFHVTWNQTGARHRRAFSTTADAFRATRPQAPKSSSVSTVLHDWASQRAWASATRKRVDHLIHELIDPRLGPILADDLRPRQIRAWLTWLDTERRYSPATIRRNFCVLRAALDWAADNKIIAANPCTKVAPPRVPRTQRATALTRLTPPSTTPPAHHRRHRPLAELRQILHSSATAEELTAYLRHLNPSSAAH